MERQKKKSEVKPYEEELNSSTETTKIHTKDEWYLTELIRNSEERGHSNCVLNIKWLRGNKCNQILAFQNQYFTPN